MCGGIVIGVARRVGSDWVLLNVEGTGKDAGVCVTRRVIEKDATNGETVEIGIGDEIWWYQDKIAWTPAGIDDRPIREQGRSWDIRLRRYRGPVETIQQL